MLEDAFLERHSSFGCNNLMLGDFLFCRLDKVIETENHGTQVEKMKMTSGVEAVEMVKKMELSQEIWTYLKSETD